jgi:steroid delta-isomerase-like uncharacterized protein
MTTPETVHKTMIDAWNRRDFETMRNMLHAEYSYTGGDGKELSGGPDTGVAVAQAYAAALPDGRAEVRSTYVQGNTAISEFRVRGTHRGELLGVSATEKPVDITVCNIVELRDGKVYREREYVDGAAILTQIGALTSAAHA